MGGTPSRRRSLVAPAVGIGAGGSLAVVTLLVTALFDGPQLPVANARVLLAGTFGALVTIGAFTFWMRPLAAQLAATALPPRTVVVVMDDRFQRVVVGVAVGALTFQAAMVLQLPASGNDAPAIPVVTGTVLAVTAIVGLLIAMQQAVESTRPGRVLADLVAQITDHLRSDAASRATTEVDAPEGEGQHVLAPASGWVLGIDEDGLMGALPPGSTVRAEIGEGSFVVGDWTPLLTVWTPDPIDDARTSSLSRHVRIGDQRGAELDLPGSVSHLADIGIHAAGGSGAPSIVNEVLWQIGVVLHVAMRCEIGRGGRRNDDGTSIIWTRRLDHGELVVLAVETLRRAAGSDPAVALELVHVLCDVRMAAQQFGRTDAVAAIDDQLDLCVAQARHSGAFPDDVDAVARARRGVEEARPEEWASYRGDDNDTDADADGRTARTERRSPVSGEHR